MLALLVWFWLLAVLLPSPLRPSRGRPFVPAPIRSALRARKPEWVTREVIRLKAHLAGFGCRKVADTFNRLHAARHGMRVSKSYVATTVRRHLLEIQELRREWKRRVPPTIPANRIWGLDLTGKTDTAGCVHPILGIVDHGSRVAVSLRVLADRSTITILRSLLDAIERFGKPWAVRTDNEAMFVSWLFRLVLWALGIRQQRTAPHCPWQNGRIERFFGTLKERLDRWAVESGDQLGLALGDFRLWYNHVRPHQHLGGRTPAEAWLRIDPYATAPTGVHHFSAWDGMLTGLYLRR
jgi:transposase InsO family protein